MWAVTIYNNYSVWADSNRLNHQICPVGFSLLHIIFYPEVERLEASAVVGSAANSVYKNGWENPCLSDSFLPHQL